MLAHPSSIGKFHITGLLGRGAMGVVYKAHDPDIDRVVAIKLIRADLLDGDDRKHHIARFRNEAKMVGRCVHPNIVGIHEFAEHEGVPFLVLEYVDGQDLGRLCRRGVRLDLAFVSRVALGVLDALAFAHEFGVIHRDIKPGNVMLTASAELKVTDFGISRALSSDATRSSVLIGTPCYMSPEQCLGGAIDARSDLFSLGCVLYEMLAGERGFAGPNYVATTYKILHEAAAPLAGLRPDLPAAVIEVVERALAKRPDDRFEGAAAMAAALRLALHEDAPPPPADADATVMMAAVREDEGETARPEIDALTVKSLATIERRLAVHVGPIGRVYLRRALRRARTPEDLAAHLADFITDEKARADLHHAILAVVAGDDGLAALRSQMAVSTRSEGGVPQATVDAMTRALAQIVGPIAPRLLQRALLDANSPEELETACLTMIEQPRERERLRALLHPRSRGRG